MYKKKCSNSFIIGETQRRIALRNHSSLLFCIFAKIFKLTTYSRFQRKSQISQVACRDVNWCHFFLKGVWQSLPKLQYAYFLTQRSTSKKFTLKIHFQQYEITHVHSCIICNFKIVEATLMPIRRHNMGHPHKLIMSDFPVWLDAKDKVQRKDASYANLYLRQVASEK